ncbi:MAG TPA: protein-disulfide reductase DsbD domain-containing protein [Xanthobacteraceae bacterium]|nr:protein-disulfide reductase DsbD domain-containing protein [Xanthobacteraceae bacterium]
MRLHGVPLRQVTAVWLLLAAASLLGSEACAAEDASPWDGDARSAVRLIAGTRMPGSGASLRAGIEIKLKPGWHTYWRYPGDAGVPPHFDFSGSQNLNTIEVLWPAPRRLEEAGLSTIGYDHDLILPLRLTPRDLHQPIALRLKLAYAICEKLCVPAESSVALGLAGGESTQEPRLAAAEAQVPHKATLGLVSAPLSISKISREGDTDHPRMLIDVAVSTGKQVDLFAEGPTAEWALPLPVPVAGAPRGQQRFALELDGAPPGATFAGALINLTAVSGDDAIEVPFHLD